MSQTKPTVLAAYNLVGDDIYYHHTRTEPTGEKYYHAPGAHSQYEVHYLIEGKLSYIIDGVTYRVREGDMIFVAPNEIHMLEIDGSSAYERMVILFDMEILGRMMKSLGASLGAFSEEKSNRIHVMNADAVRSFGASEIMRDIIASDSEPEYKKLEVISKLIRFVIAIDKIVSSGAAALSKPTQADPIVTAVSEYIERNISKKIKLDELAASLFVSPSTLSHRFHRIMGLGVGRYVTMKKMYHAAALISSGASASEAAIRVGYDNYNSFFHSFREIIGSSPSALIHRDDR